MYLVSECICILVYNMQNVAMNRFCWGSLTLLNNPHCHSFDFSSAAQVIFSPRPSPTCDLSPKTGLKHHLDHQWPVHSLCRCALPQVRSCAHLGPSVWLWCKHNKHMMQSNPMTHSWFLTIREQPIIYKRRLLTRSLSRGQLSAVFLNSPTGFSDKRFWMRSHNQTGSARAQKPPQFQKDRYSIFYKLSDAITRGRLFPKSVTAPSSRSIHFGHQISLFHGNSRVFKDNKLDRSQSFSWLRTSLRIKFFHIHFDGYLLKGVSTFNVVIFGHFEIFLWIYFRITRQICAETYDASHLTRVISC